MFIRKSFDVTIEKSSGAFDARFVMSASAPDRVKDTIEPSAYKANLGKKLIALYQHDHDKPIGFWDNLRVEGGKLIGDIKFASTNLAQMVKTLIADGVPLGASIGFRGKGSENKAGGIHFSELELLECSVVSVPAHPAAMQIAKSFGISIEEASSRADAASTRKAVAAQSTSSVLKGTVMKISDQIKAAQLKSVEARDTLVSLQAKADNGEDVSTEIDVQMDAVEKADAEVTRLTRYEKLTAGVTAKPAGAPAVIKSGNRAEPKCSGDIMFKHATAKLIAFAEKKSVEQVMDERYADTNFVKATYEVVQKAAAGIATTTDANWASALVQEDTRGFIDSLKDVSVAAALSGKATSLDFGGYNSIKIPRRNPLAATLTEPAWVGEGGAIPLTQFSFGSQTINRYKLAAITTMSKEIVERSTPSIEGLVRAGLQEAYAEVLDAALLSSGAAVAGIRPAGLLAGVTPVAGHAGGGEDAVRSDILAAITAMAAARVGARPVILINNLDKLAAAMMTTAMSDYLFRAELASGNLMGYPVIASANVPQHTLIVVDAAYLAIAFDAPMFDVSDVATVVEADAGSTAPTMAVTGAGVVGTAGQVPAKGGISANGLPAGAGTTGASVRSLWQTYSIGIRMVAPTSWALMQAGAVRASTSTTWTS